jgi:hypothetical protein
VTGWLDGVVEQQADQQPLAQQDIVAELPGTIDSFLAERQPPVRVLEQK